MSPTPSSTVSAPADHTVDVLVVGGGINGVGIARDLAGRGWRVLLCEQDDLASHTSSASTKLIHGGLRYLEYGEFGLVRKALMEREVLLRSAPHIMWPLRFVLPHDASMRPAWMIRAGLWLYDHLARREFLPGSHAVALDRSPLGGPLQPGWRKGFVYSDGWVDDARLVVLCARDAVQRGAKVLTRTRCAHITAEGHGWRAELLSRDAHTGDTVRRVSVRARSVVNAAGPWAEHLLRQVMRVQTPGNHGQGGQGGVGNPGRLRLVKGSHIVVPRLFDHDHAYIFQGQDRRIIFAIPYETHYTLVGTTDVEWRDDPARVAIDGDEVAYLCRELGRYLARPIQPADVVWSYAGVRPLLDDASGNAAAVTRDYLLQARAEPAPWLTVWGGKLTTFRVLAEQAAHQVGALLGEPRRAWTADATLPGGDLAGVMCEPLQPGQALSQYLGWLLTRYPWMEVELLQRWARTYGSEVPRLLEGASTCAELGAEVAPGVFERELLHLVEHEWAQTGDDVLWRRTKLGLHLDAAGREQVRQWLRQRAVQSFVRMRGVGA
ncbi:glycerol-3-phosphate dehydrogenase [Aquabacterium fontiphilum]|uniref:glycerol-3-phosphate dehydrogenase n=1 Tax=Aquabacterium fontiphilum TaxID=450365 RepID=UPI001EFFAC30|nr:glycerol-3-phosphate dehydrogenase [Aquabacterium fontiphilum]